jgi:hypothetical protein
MVTIQLSNFNKNPKNHRPKNKTAPTFNKKTIFLFQNKINNTKSPLKSGKQEKINSKSKYKLKKTSERN